MTRAEPFLAVITDMDGVITRTARVHERAWQRMFDAFLDSREDRDDEDHSPFTPHDYLQHVDGKPRLDGVRDFLASRGITLPEGSPDDGADRDTVQGLGTRKNESFRATLERDGVETFADTLAACARWRRGGLPLAAISASRNCRHVLGTAGVIDRFETIVDGRTAAEEGLDGKPGLIRTAAERLGVPLERTVLLEDAIAGIEAGREVGCGLVVFVDREGDAASGEPIRGQADIAVQDLGALRFPRRIPDLLDRTDAFDRLRDGRPLTVFLDFDGTLSPIVDDPDAATISDAMRESVRELAERATVAVVSGRDRADVEARAEIEGLFYAGSHGLDIAGPGRELLQPDAEAAVDDVAAAERHLHEIMGGVEGTVIERKRFSVALHYRMVDEAHVERVRMLAEKVLDASPRLRARTGKKVIELMPAIDWDKGRAVEWLLDALDVNPDADLVLYLGDDETDEDAFAALTGRGLGIHVGPEVSDSLGDFRLADPKAVETFLRRLAGT